MAAGLVVEPLKRRQVRQQPSVPFLWEERPGVAKKNWRPEFASSTPILQLPIKLIASVPFEWEEKPEKPLQCFTNTDFYAPAVRSSSATHTQNDSEVYDTSDKKDAFDWELQNVSPGTDDSLSSAPSLMANCLVPSATVSTAVPVQESLLMAGSGDQLETPSSPASESGSSTSSYATGLSSLVGSAFLECLFPLYSPNPGFLGKEAYFPRGLQAPKEQNIRDFGNRSNSGVVIWRPQTLGELIAMSRRRSCQRKAVQMRKQKLSMELTKNKVSGCFIFGNTTTLINRLQKKGHQLRLKLP